VVAFGSAQLTHKAFPTSTCRRLARPYEVLRECPPHERTSIRLGGCSKAVGPLSIIGGRSSPLPHRLNERQLTPVGHPKADRSLSTSFQQSYRHHEVGGQTTSLGNVTFISDNWDG
jgi:hypothetical protein